MPYYSVLIQGDQARPLATELRETFRGKPADYTGHPVFFVKNHRKLDDFRQTVEGMLPDGHAAVIRRITKGEFDE